MLLELTRWLQQLESLFGLFGYLTFRGILAALTSLFLSLWMGPAVIRRLAQFRHRRGQPCLGVVGGQIQQVDAIGHRSTAESMN